MDNASTPAGANNSMRHCDGKRMECFYLFGFEGRRVFFGVGVGDDFGVGVGEGVADGAGGS